ncbi:hypothetical protein EDD37DRAFT_608658 [Exophiala viscosa]|uniref:uncharacterized protein n=1 Tax=Exophiala viscosa TaxID=2486360 RepID=UPI00219113F6|nr:hypothetical protein EDD37DRAFT_608658 [Exophiala viscosa]
MSNSVSSVSIDEVKVRSLVWVRQEPVCSQAAKKQPANLITFAVFTILSLRPFFLPFHHHIERADTLHSLDLMFPNNNNPFFFQGFGSNNGQWHNNALNPNAGAYVPNPAGQGQNQQPWGQFNPPNGPLGQQGMAQPGMAWNGQTGWNSQVGTAMGQPMGQPMVPNNGMSMLPTQLPQGDPQVLQLQQERLSLQGQMQHLQTQQQLSSMQEQMDQIQHTIQGIRRPANSRGRGRGRGGGSRNPRNAGRGNLNNNINSGQDNTNHARNNPRNSRRGRSALAVQNPGRVGRHQDNADRQQQLQRLQERVQVFEQQHGRMPDNNVLPPQVNAAPVNNVTQQDVAGGTQAAYGAGFTQGHQAGLQQGVNATARGLMTQAMAGPIQDLVEETVRRELNHLRRVTELPDEEGDGHQPTSGADA